MYGLLQGLGRGLSQGADMMQRAMSEDREAERQRIREASIEKRWKQQEAKADARYADAKKLQAEQIEYQKGRDATADTRYADAKKLQADEIAIRLSDRRKAEIEGKVEAVQREWDKGTAAIERRHERLIDEARAKDAEGGGIKDKDGFTETDKAYKARDNALADLGSRMEGKLMPIIKSYGTELKGTAYSSLYDDIVAEKSAAKDQAGQQFLNDAGVIDAAGGFTATAAKTGSGRKGIVDGITAGSAAASPQQQAPEMLQPGFVSGLKVGASGIYNGSKVDMSDASPLERITTPVGAYLGHIATPNLIVDAGQALSDKAIKPGLDWATTRPSEKTPPRLPGETDEQYFVRISQQR